MCLVVSLNVCSQVYYTLTFCDLHRGGGLRCNSGRAPLHIKHNTVTYVLYHVKEFVTAVVVFFLVLNILGRTACYKTQVCYKLLKL